MKRLIPFLILLLLAVSASGQATNRITLTISVTNRAVTGNTLVVNASSRYWTNASTATTIQTNLVSTATTATNLYNQIASFPYSGGIFPRWLSETSMALIGPLGGALAASQAGDWCILTLSTQSAPLTFTALWPIENLPTATNRTNQASAFVGGLSQFSTNAFATNSTAMSNAVVKGASPLQTVASPFQFTGRVSANSQFFATNGFTSTLTNINSVSSNHVNYGNALRSEGSGGNSLQVGSNAVASGAFATALGNSSVASADYAFASGTEATATGASSTAIGVSADATAESATAGGQNSEASGISSTAYGQEATASADFSAAFGSGTGASAAYAYAIGGIASAIQSAAVGYGAQAAHSNSIAIGPPDHAFSAVATTDTNQVRLGTANHRVSVPGQLLVSGSQSNTTFRGTNIVNGRIDFTSRANTALVNGANSAIVLGTNVYVRLSGATTVAGISGFAAEHDGSFHVVQFTGAITNVIVNEVNSTDIATDAAAANRIVTGTGTNYYFTNSPLVLGVIYDGTASRWRLLSVHR